MTSSETPSRWKPFVSWLLRLGVAAGLLHVIFTRIPFHEVLEVLRTSRLELVAAGLLIGIAGFALGAVRMKPLTDHVGMAWSVRELALISFSSAFYGGALPGLMAGGVVKWHRLAQPNRMRAQAFACIAFSRLVYMMSLLAVGVVFLLLDGQYARHPLAGASLLGLLAGMGLVGCVVFRQKTARAVSRHLERWPPLLAPAWFRSRAQKILEASGQFQHLSGGSLGRAVGAALGEFAVGIVVMALFAAAVGIDLSLVQIGWVRACTVIVTGLPISISGLGVREGTLLALLTPYGVSGTETVALSLLLLIGFLAPVGVGGVCELVRVVRGSGKTNPSRGTG